MVPSSVTLQDGLLSMPRVCCFRVNAGDSTAEGTAEGVSTMMSHGWQRHFPKDPPVDIGILVTLGHLGTPLVMIQGPSRNVALAPMPQNIDKSGIAGKRGEAAD